MSRKNPVPKGAWDTHIHIFDPHRVPYAPKRPYTPRPALLTDYPASVTGCSSLVVVHASMQGASPAALVDTLTRGQDVRPGFTFRGLATLDIESVTDAELDSLHAAGVRGTRMHEMAWGYGEQSGGGDIIKRIRALEPRIARLGWVISIFCPLPAWAALADTIRGLDPRVKIIADHLGTAFPGSQDTPEFQVLLSLIRERRLFVKMSGFDRLSHGHQAGVESIAPIATAIIQAGPDQIIYGSDWPHTQLGITRSNKTDEQRLSEVEEFRAVDDDAHIQKLREWIPDDDTWRKLFIENPKRLFL